MRLPPIPIIFIIGTGVRVDSPNSGFQNANVYIIDGLSPARAAVGLVGAILVGAPDTAFAPIGRDWSSRNGWYTATGCGACADSSISCSAG